MNGFRLAVRQFTKAPGFALVAVFTLALGIGATTAIFSVVYPVVLRPLPFPDSERLVAVWTRTSQVERLPVGAADHQDLRSQVTAFEDIAILRPAASYNLTGEGEPERLLASRIPANLFPLLRVQPFLGRGFTEPENQPGQDRVVILSHGFWQRRYAGDPGIVGKTIRLENLPYTVVGVMAPEFHYPAREVQIWTPLTINPDDYKTRTGYAHLAIARLKPGYTLKQAQNQVDAVATRLAQEHPTPNKDIRLKVTPLRQDIAGVARTPLIVLLASSLALLLIGCGNLISLLLVRTLSRRREIAVRSALGATRFRLLRQATLELLPILALGSAAGMLAAKWGISLLLPWLPPALPRIEEIQVNLPVLLFSTTVLLPVAACMVWIPMLQAGRNDLITTLREDLRTSSAALGRMAILNALIVGQVALTVILLTGAGLLIRTFAALREVDPGFRTQGVLSLQLAIPRNKYGSDDQVAAVCERILSQVRALPGVAAAGMANRLPLSGSSGLSSVEFERSHQATGTLEATDETTTTPDYFVTMGIPLLDGRTFTERDTPNGPLVLMVDEQVARQAWPGENPIGKRMRSGPTGPWAEVVGVVGHVRHERLDSEQRLQIYWNYRQRPRDRMALVVRTSADAEQLANPILQAIKAVDPDQPAYAIRTLSNLLDQTLALRRFNTLIVGAFAGASLLLAMIGIYGLIAWTVRQRTREMGIRLAFGARPGQVFALVVQRGFKLATLGVGIGVAGGLVVTRLMATQLYGVNASDPATYLAVGLLSLVVALVACWLPARRAARVDPIVALRDDG